MIGGKLYDTEKAELLHWWDNGGNAWDFRAMEERLYRTKDGSLFIAGSGGPMTHYRTRVVGEGWDPGSGIRVVSKDEAISWLEEHGGTEVILDDFAEELEGDQDSPVAAGWSEGTRLIDDYPLDYTGLLDDGYTQKVGWCRVQFFEPGESQDKPVIVLSDPDVRGYEGPEVWDNAAIIAAKVLSRHALSTGSAILIGHYPGTYGSPTAGAVEYFWQITFPEADRESTPKGPDELGTPGEKEPLDWRELQILVGDTREL